VYRSVTEGYGCYSHQPNSVQGQYASVRVGQKILSEFIIKLFDTQKGIEYKEGVVASLGMQWGFIDQQVSEMIQKHDIRYVGHGIDMSAH
jgi:hypothetical protein